MNNILVSIVMPVYNSEATLSKAINSVIKQTYTNWELICVNDCSSDNSLNILNKFSLDNKRINVINGSTKAKYGAAEVRNKAINVARGRYIMFLDSDDIYLPNKIANQVKFMSENNVLFSYSDYYVYDNKAKIIKATHNTPPIIKYRDILRTCKIGCLTACYDAEVLGKIYMPVEAEKREDFATWAMILKRTNAVRSPGINAIYRVDKGSVSSNKFKMIPYQFKVYRKILNINLIKSLYYMTSWAFYGLLKYRAKNLNNIENINEIM